MGSVLNGTDLSSFSTWKPINGVSINGVSPRNLTFLDLCVSPSSRGVIAARRSLELRVQPQMEMLDCGD